MGIVGRTPHADLSTVHACVCILFMKVFKFVTTKHCYSNNYRAVTGFGGSRLSVQDMSEGECNTKGGNVTLWRNTEYVATSPQCFLNQFR